MRARSLITPIIVIAILVVGGLWGWSWWRHARQYQSTDNAQVTGNILPISSRVAGQVVKVTVADNQPVKKGDLLVELDRRDFELKVKLAREALEAARKNASIATWKVQLAQEAWHADVQETTSSLESTRRQVATAGERVETARLTREQTAIDIDKARANVAQAQANVKVAQAEQERLASDLERYRKLYQNEEVSEQQFQASETAADQARLRVQAARDQVAVAQAQVDQARAASAVASQAIVTQQASQAELSSHTGEAQGRVMRAQTGSTQVSLARAQEKAAQTEVGRAKAALEQAELELSYTRIYAPADGLIARKNVEVGQYVQPGSPFLAVVDDSDLWVVANLKETQMGKVVPGLPARIVVDAYPGKTVEARVQSIQAGTGAVFSMFPPENASGNFVKVVQRIPVKLVPDGSWPFPVRPGMSVEASIKVE